jgi:hypothetical protein
MHSSVHYGEPKGKGLSLFLLQTRSGRGKMWVWSQGLHSFTAFQLHNTSDPVLQ